MIGKQISFRIICILSLVILGTQCWRPFKIEITNLSTYSLVNYMESNSSISKQNSVSIYINVLKYLTEIYAKVTVTITSANGNYSSVLFNKTIDCCEFLKNPKYEPIVQVFYRALTINGSFPKNCPITKKLYFIKNVSIDPNNFPPLMPYNGVLIIVHFMQKDGETFNTIGGFTMNTKIYQR